MDAQEFLEIELKTNINIFHPVPPQYDWEDVINWMNGFWKVNKDETIDNSKEISRIINEVKEKAKLLCKQSKKKI